MQGFVSVHRKMMNNPLWSDPHYLKLWMYCLFQASHKEHEQLVGNKMITLQRGQFVTGRFSLAEDLNHGMKPKQKLNERTWFRYLNNLEKWGMLTIKTTNKYSVVTIDKYDFYQTPGNQYDQQTDQQLSNKSPSNDQQMSTNNNGNNGNNENKKSPKQVYDEDSLYFKMADYFYKLILKNNPNHRKPKLQKWADDFRKLVELDKRNKDEIRKVMEWVHNDSFEHKVVLSASKFRERYDNLFMKAKEELGVSDEEPKDKRTPDQIEHDRMMEEMGYEH